MNHVFNAYVVLMMQNGQFLYYSITIITNYWAFIIDALKCKQYLNVVVCQNGDNLKCIVG